MQKAVKKTSRLKRGALVPSGDRQAPTEPTGETYRAGNIGRQSRPWGQNKVFYFLQIRVGQEDAIMREEVQVYARETLSMGQGKQSTRPTLSDGT